MVDSIRVLGYLLLAVGIVVLITWFFEPLRTIWPYLLQLPLPLKIGGGAVTLGMGFIVISLITERIEDRRSGADDP